MSKTTVSLKDGVTAQVVGALGTEATIVDFFAVCVELTLTFEGSLFSWVEVLMLNFLFIRSAARASKLSRIDSTLSSLYFSVSIL